MNSQFTDTFRKGSTTFFNSSFFFPAATREKVTRLYAFVREADDYVDCIPPDEAGFFRFKEAYRAAVEGSTAGPAVVQSFVQLEKECGFQASWARSFLEAMEQDLTKTRYETLEETLAYIYGSAEVVGLMMARIMELPFESEEAARLLGRAFQYVNFIRDIQEDVDLGRQYLPAAEMRAEGLTELSLRQAQAQPEAFSRFIRRQLQRYRAWRGEAQQGFHFIPRRYRIAIQTAADMYDDTAERIERDPLVIFQYKVKPGKSRIFLTALKHALFMRED